jgi:hypothetical protein
VIDDGTRVCAVCGRVLAQHQLGRITYRYEHSVHHLDDHPPIPVRPGEVPQQLRLQCDICVDEPITHTLVVDRELGFPSADVIYDTEWALCQVCSALVMSDDWISLRRRAFDKFVATYGGPLSEETKTDLRVMYRDLRRHLLFIYEEPGVQA